MNDMTAKIVIVVLGITMCGLSSPPDGAAAEEGLLFHYSASEGFTADFARGNPDAVVIEEQEIVDDGAVGKAISCPDFENVIAFESPGNLYAQRGTLAFFLRPRYPLGETPFTIFQASYSDHSSFDMQWMRVDYNGSGFDAFVTDRNLARIRVSHHPDTLPAADEWTHLAVAWDENRGIRLYVDGELAARKDTVAVFDAGMGFFGTHGYFINPLFIGSGSHDLRGADFDEFRIYDSMLDQFDIAMLAGGNSLPERTLNTLSLSSEELRSAWLLRHGWNRSDDPPPYLDSRETSVRFIGITDAYDLKQWFWKGCDGIRETTWPGVMNRSSIIGRADYFTLPDWNCYSLSGKSVTFSLPDEEWNHIEIAGAAFGTMDHLVYSHERSSDTVEPLFDRPADQERTAHRLDAMREGGRLRFTNDVQETPIGEIMVSRVEGGRAPAGSRRLTYRVDSAAAPDNPTLAPLIEHIEGRHMPGERTTVVALPSGAPRTGRTSGGQTASLPLVHVLIPCDFRTISTGSTIGRYSYTWENIGDGLAGIIIDLPALDVRPTHGGLYPMNIAFRDPLWPARTLADFTFSVKPGEERTLWIDTRDRILPDDKSIYLTVAGAGEGLAADALHGMRVTLVFKARQEAEPEHIGDRFVQVKDNYGNIIESAPNSKLLPLYDRLHRDMVDLLRIDPHHFPGRNYWCHLNPEQGWPAFEQPQPPPGVPVWAFRQIEHLRLVGDVILWWIDNRQIENGELGGGLSDDSDFTNSWPIPALMGIEPDKITDSLHRELEAIYDIGMFTDGLNTYQMDGLHTTEEGTNVQAQLMMLEYGDPKLVERLMETARAFERVTGINSAGHRHFRSSFFSATEIAEERPWQWTMYQAFRLLHPGMSLVEFNGNPRAKKTLLELADGVVAHRRKDERGRWRTTAVVNYATDEDRGSSFGSADHLLWGAWHWTGDERYLQPMIDNGHGAILGLNANVIDILDEGREWARDYTRTTTPHSGGGLQRWLAFQLTGDLQFIEELYADEIAYHSREMYLMTEGHVWTDRVAINALELQRSRLGGIARRKKSAIYPGQVVSWRFREPSSWDDLAILVPEADATSFTVTAWNCSDGPVTADMTGWMIDPGEWEMERGIDTDGDFVIDGDSEKIRVRFERTESVTLTFDPGVQTVIHMSLKKKGTPYWKRPDLGIGKEDVEIADGKMLVTVHSLGSVDCPKGEIAVIDSSGNSVATAETPAIEAPLDLFPRTAEVSLELPAGGLTGGLRVVLNPGGSFEEITRMNNIVELP